MLPSDLVYTSAVPYIQRIHTFIHILITIPITDRMRIRTRMDMLIPTGTRIHTMVASIGAAVIVGISSVASFAVASVGFAVASAGLVVASVGSAAANVAGTTG